MSESAHGANREAPAGADRSLAFAFSATNPAYHADPLPWYRALLAGPPVQVKIGTLTTVFPATPTASRCCATNSASPA